MTSPHFVASVRSISPSPSGVLGTGELLPAAHQSVPQRRLGKYPHQRPVEPVDDRLWRTRADAHIVDDRHLEARQCFGDRGLSGGLASSARLVTAIGRSLPAWISGIIGSVRIDRHRYPPACHILYRLARSTGMVHGTSWTSGLDAE